jgi:multimeric flavodoxin WrbA
LPAKNVVILDGSPIGDRDLSPILNLLSDVLKADGAQIQVFPLREMKLAHCLGCFNCWIKTPGMCVEADAGREIAKAVIQSDVAVLFTPVTFGGYSPELKKMVDHFVQLISPFFAMDHGEVHHPPRYTHRARLLGVGVQRHPNAAEAHIFKTLVGRNAINLHPSSYAAEVVLASDNRDSLRACFQALLTRSDELPFGEAAACLMPAPVQMATPVEAGEARRALLIIGSPKTNAASTSSSLGSFLLDHFQKQGWETESLTLRASLHRREGQNELLSAVDRANLVLLVFPLYADTLPYLLTKALTVVSAHRRENRESSQQRLMAIVNSGFPETHQNAIALAICREFATQNGFTWAGGLAFGAGGMIGGRPLTDTKRPGPSLKNVIAALELTAASLAKGFPVPVEALKIVERKGIGSALFNRIYMWMGTKSFEKVAGQNGISKEKLKAQPYAA